MPRWSFVREWFPPALIPLVAPLAGHRTRFRGAFDSWIEACHEGAGYGDAEIVERVRAATREVVAGTVAAERDGSRRGATEPPFELIALVLAVACETGRAAVLDFGGGLGGTYYQCRQFLTAVKKLEWIVVEQSGFAKCGSEEFETDVLRFAGDLEYVLTAMQPNVAVLSGVLQYVSDPLYVLARIARERPDYIFIDRTPFIRASKHVITMQFVPRQLGGHRYPVWLFREDSLLESLYGDYELGHRFDAVDGVMSYRFRRVDFKGFIFRRRKR